MSSSADKDKIFERLRRYGISAEPVKYIPNAYRISEGGEIAGKTLEFILGIYYMQSLSSMLPALVLGPTENDTVLDICAAPGSKTTQLAEMMKNKGTLIANEVSMDRLKSLVFNIDKMNLVNVGVMHGKGELLSGLFENQFDKILVDAPCSALGIVQKKGEVSNWWDIRKAESISDLQLRLLVAAVKMCKSGGEIVYSTCTLTLEENECVINKVLKKYPVELISFELPVQSREGFTSYKGENFDKSLLLTHRILPWEAESEGFFIAKFRKLDDPDFNSRPPRREKKSVFLKASSGKIKNYIGNLAYYYGISREEFDEFKFMLRGNDFNFVGREWNSDHLDKFNRIGTRFGAVDKHDFLQLNSLAARLLGRSVSQNTVTLDGKRELDVYFNGGSIRKNIMGAGQKIVKYEDYILGTAVSSKEGLKSQFPRAFRTQEIILL